MSPPKTPTQKSSLQTRTKLKNGVFFFFFVLKLVLQERSLFDRLLTQRVYSL